MTIVESDSWEFSWVVIWDHGNGELVLAQFSFFSDACYFVLAAGSYRLPEAGFSLTLPKDA